MCHNPAKLFQIHKRGFIRKGYYADLVLLDLEKETQIFQHNIYSKCKWSPIENQTLSSRVVTTIVNGHIVYNNGIFNETKKGKRLQFDRS
jgi:dihydroorotase